MNATKTILATSISQTLASVADVVKGETYLYKGKQVKALKVFKKSGKVVVKGDHMTQNQTVKIEQLSVYQVTAEELAMETVYKAMKEANKTLEVAEKTLRTIRKGSDVATSPEFAAALKARHEAYAKAMFARTAFVMTKHGNKSEGAFDLKSVAKELNTDHVEDLLSQAYSNYQEIDKNERKELANLYGLIEIVNLVKIASNLNRLDSGSDYTTEFRIALHRKRLEMTHTTHGYVNVWQTVFGGSNKKSSNIPCVDEVVGIPVAGVRKTFLGLEIADTESELQGLVQIRGKGGLAIRSEAGKKTVGIIPLKEAVRKLSFVENLVFLRTVKTEEGIKVQDVHSLSVAQKLLGMHKAQVDVNGLKDHKLFKAVVKLGFHGNTWSNSSVLSNDPIAVLQAEDRYDEETVAIANFLRAKGYGPASHAENYQKHGYVQEISTYNRKTVNTFINEKGESWEGFKKLLVRLLKQVWNEGLVQFDNVKTAVVGLVDPDYKGLPSTVNKEALAKANINLGRALVAGQAIASKEAYKFMGLGRFVTGEEVVASGQKTVVSGPKQTMVPELAHVYFNVCGGHSERFVIAGLNSTKSAQFVHSAGWTLETFEDKDGETIAIWVKTTREKYKLTDSATAGAFTSVSKKLQGIEAAKDSLLRATESHSSETATKMIYANNGLTLQENIESLLSQDLIKPKTRGVFTNSQFNTGLEVQFGSEVAKAILTTLVKSNLAGSFRNNIATAIDLATKSVDSQDVAEIDAIDIIQTLAAGCAAIGIPTEDVTGKVLHINLVLQVMQLLASHGKKWLNINFGNDRKVLFPITQDFLDSVEPTGRDMYVGMEGPAAEFMETFAFHLNTAKEDFNEDTGESVFEVTISEAAADVAVSKLAKIRDNLAGKPLNRVPAIGATMLLVTSAHLHGNETFAPKLTVLAAAAKTALRENVTCLYFKSPILWKGSISAAHIVDVISKVSETAQWLEQFGGDEDYEQVMMGNASYISPEKAVKNGNDADGDLNSFIFVATTDVQGSVLANTKVFVDATDPKVAAGAHHYARKWEKELAGLYYNPEDTGEFTSVSEEEFAKQFEKAIVGAAQAKQNVSFFTSYQTITLNHRGVYFNTVDEVLKRTGSVFPKYMLWAEKVRNNPVAAQVLAEAIWSFSGDAQGALVNLDAMDLVKQNDSNIKKLAAMLSPRELSRLHFGIARNHPFYKQMAEAGNLRGIRDAIYKEASDLSKQVRDTMFDPETHNLAIDQLAYVLPSFDGDVKRKQEIEHMVAYMMILFGANVGATLTTEYDITQQILTSAPKVNGKATPLNLEKLKDILQEASKKEVEFESVQRTIVSVALSYNNKVLV